MNITYKLYIFGKKITSKKYIMKKIFLILLIGSLQSCDGDYPTHEYNKYTFDLESTTKFPEVNSSTSVNIDLQEFTSITPAKYKFKFTTTKVAILKNNGIELKENEFYEIDPGKLLSLEYTSSTIGINNLNFEIQNLTYPGGSNQSPPKQFKDINISSIGTGFNFSAYNYKFNYQNELAIIVINVVPDGTKTLADYNLYVIIKKSNKAIYEPFITIDDVKYYNGDKLPLNSKETLVKANNVNPSGHYVDYIQFKLDDGSQILFSDQLSIATP